MKQQNAIIRFVFSLICLSAPLAIAEESGKFTEEEIQIITAAITNYRTNTGLTLLLDETYSGIGFDSVEPLIKDLPRRERIAIKAHYALNFASVRLPELQITGTQRVSKKVFASILSSQGWRGIELTFPNFEIAITVSRPLLFGGNRAVIFLKFSSSLTGGGGDLLLLDRQENGQWNVAKTVSVFLT